MMATSRQRPRSSLFRVKTTQEDRFRNRRKTDLYMVSLMGLAGFALYLDYLLYSSGIGLRIGHFVVSYSIIVEIGIIGPTGHFCYYLTKSKGLVITAMLLISAILLLEVLFEVLAGV